MWCNTAAICFNSSVGNKKGSQKLFSADILITSISYCLASFRFLSSWSFSSQCQQVGIQLRCIRMSVPSTGPHCIHWHLNVRNRKIKPDTEKSFWDPVLAASRNPETAKAMKRFSENGLLFQYHKQMHSTLALPFSILPPPPFPHHLPARTVLGYFTQITSQVGHAALTVSAFQRKHAWKTNHQ